MAKKSEASVSLAQRLISEFKLVNDREYIRFKDGPLSTANPLLAACDKDFAAKYGVKVDSKVKPVELVHTSSFNKNPIRYIFKMIDDCSVGHVAKANRKKKVSEIVKEAMADDPLKTVQAIVNSMARVAKF